MSAKPLEMLNLQRFTIPLAPLVKKSTGETSGFFVHYLQFSSTHSIARQARPEILFP